MAVIEKRVKRAVVIDDDQPLLKAISSILERRGYEVHVSSEPAFCPIFLYQACPCAEEHACTHVVITDLNMPNMSGLQFIEKQKNNGCKVQNIAVMSAVWGRNDLEVLTRLGCKTLGKPFKMAELTDWLEECENREDFHHKLSELPG